MANKPYIMWSLGPRALKYESLEPYIRVRVLGVLRVWGLGFGVGSNYVMVRILNL